MGQDNLSLYERDSINRAVSIVGIPLELGSDVRGFAETPDYLLKAGLEKMISNLGGEVSDIAMVACQKPQRVVSGGTVKYLDEIVTASRRSCELVEKAARRKDFVLAIGGDHSMAAGSIPGVAAAYPSIGVIWIDAHPDANTHETTISGNVHGMPAAAAMGFGHPLLTGIGVTTQKVSPKNFLYIGLKDIDKHEIEFLRREKVQCVTMLDIAERGLSRAIMAIDDLRKRVDTIWVSMDLDSIDEQYAPGVGMATPGGLTRREVLNLAQYIGKKCKLAGMDIVEIVPAKDKEGKTATLALELIARFLGGERSWYEDYMEHYRSTNVTAATEKKRVRKLR